MAVFKKRATDIPTDAVILSPEQAYTFQLRIIQNWEPKNEVWALRFTPGILGSLSAVSGIYINNHFRKKLKLGNYGRFSSYLPIVVLPAVVAAIYHKGFIQKSIILDTEVCPICTELRSASFQLAFGVIYPTLLAPFASLMFATRHYTYRLPSITENPKEVLRLIYKMAKPLVPLLGASIIGQSLIAMFLTYKEMKNFYEMQLKFQDIEGKIEEIAAS